MMLEGFGAMFSSLVLRLSLTSLSSRRDVGGETGFRQFRLSQLSESHSENHNLMERESCIQKHQHDCLALSWVQIPPETVGHLKFWSGLAGTIRTILDCGLVKILSKNSDNSPLRPSRSFKLVPKSMVETLRERILSFCYIPVRILESMVEVEKINGKISPVLHGVYRSFSTVLLRGSKLEWSLTSIVWGVVSEYTHIPVKNSESLEAKAKCPYGSKKWADRQLNFCIKLLKGEYGWHQHPYNRLILAVSIHDRLEEEGFSRKARILDFWIHEFIAYVYGKPTRHKFKVSTSAKLMTPLSRGMGGDSS